MENVTEASHAELFVVMGYLSVLSVIGTAGNSLVLYVFLQKRETVVSKVFILLLAAVDFTTCLLVIPFTIFMEYTDYRVSVDVVCKLYLFVITSNIPFSALIMVAIAVDRYLSICHPFARILNVFRAKILTGVLGLVAAGQGVCVSLIYGVYKWEEGGSGNKSRHWDDNYTTVDPSIAYMANATVGIWIEDGGRSEFQTLLVNTGTCQENELIVSDSFQWYYQKLYTAMYPACLAIVAFLYVLIYKSVLERRDRRQRQKSKILALVSDPTTTTAATTNNRRTNASGRQRLMSTTSAVGDSDETASFVAITCNDAFPDDACTVTEQSSANAASAGSRRPSRRVDAIRLANLKTAAMLFVVTVVFVVTFAPAFLMALRLVPYNMVVFYLYFANNVANPVIYSFMNHNFRSDLRRMFRGVRHRRI